jgi:maltooligosyltrehalose trehalohydrolase
MRHRHDSPFGAELGEGGVHFRLYAPRAARVDVLYREDDGVERSAPLEAVENGFFARTVADARAGTRYAFSVDGGELRLPDPASRFQPDGVHGPSLVLDPLAFEWPEDRRHVRPFHEHVFYELHVGAFTEEGTYRAAAERLDHLVALGVTALELMPLSAAPGTRNWGYDGVLPYAPSRNYGTPHDLKRFIAAAHAKDLSVFLDVVYNHFGNEGNYLGLYAPNFFTERYRTPWGTAIDVESEGNGPVRAFFIENALYWLEEYRFDGLRLDAVETIFDGPERLFLRELAAAVSARIEPRRSVALVLENDRNEVLLLRNGFRAQWDDDAHHAAHVLATGETGGYYRDFAERPVHLLGRTLTTGFAYQGEPSPYRGGRERGEPSSGLELASFITFLQNHDQIGNRAFGERITALGSDAAVRAALAVLLLAPSPPLLFMGEEWGASTPFLFFCDFEPDLARKVTEGRRAEFASFPQFADADAGARVAIPDPSDPATFARSKLDWSELAAPVHRAWLGYYRNLLQLRRTEIAPRTAGARGDDAWFEEVGTRGLAATWHLPGGTVLQLAANLGAEAQGGFAPPPADALVLFATHDPSFPNGIAPAWSVRWTLA